MLSATPRAPLLHIELDRPAGDLSGQIYRAVRQAVLAGALKPGEVLASSRRLAEGLGVSRSTVVAAYAQLQAEGYVASRPGAPLRVAALPQPAFPATAPAVPAALEPGPLKLAPGTPDLASFPHAAFARVLGGRARALRVHDLGYGEPWGLAGLRQVLLDHLRQTRGVRAAPGQVLILPSARAGLDLFARLALGGGGVAWVEDPGYAAAKATLSAAGARLVPVPCDASGPDPAGVADPTPPRLIFVTPSHQFPTGVALSLERRLRLLEIARAHGALVLEDDYDSEFQYEGRPVAALQGIDGHGTVAYIGSLSKVLAPGIGLGYAVAPPALVERARAAHRQAGLGVSIHLQAALADFIGDGQLAAHIRRQRSLYAERLALVRQTLATELGDLIETPAIPGGLQLAAWFRDGRVDDKAVVARLRGAGFGIQPLSAYFLERPRPGLLFGVAAASAPDLAAVAGIVRAALGGPRKSA